MPRVQGGTGAAVSEPAQRPPWMAGGTTPGMAEVEPRREPRPGAMQEQNAGRDSV
jgi:hypothetical protein